MIDFDEQKKVLEENKDLFKELVQLNVNDRTEKKNGLTYLSWAWAWQEFKKICPDATYTIERFEDENGVLKPYMEDVDLGYMVFTTVTAKNITHEMWLPVMDGANKAMKRTAYKYLTKAGEKTVEPCTMFDVNKTIMRCLTKNLAMFGLGLYIYAGEDMPVEIDELCTPEQIKIIEDLGVNTANALRNFKKDKLEDLTYLEADYIITTKRKALEKKGE